jgi:hypothetical protein
VSPTIPGNSKISISPTNIGKIANTTTTNPDNEFGYWVVDGNIVYGGSAKFEALDTSNNPSTVRIAVTVRVLNSTVIGQTAEDYNGIPE